MGRAFRLIVFLEMKIINKILMVSCFALVLCANLFACPLCKSAIETSTESQSISQALNPAILVLLVPPVIIFGMIFFAAYKSNKETE